MVTKPEVLQVTRKAIFARVKGKGKTERTVFLSVDARNTLADYLERERGRDATAGQTALFLKASSIAVRAPMTSTWIGVSGHRATIRPCF